MTMRAYAVLSLVFFTPSGRLSLQPAHHEDLDHKCQSSLYALSLTPFCLCQNLLGEANWKLNLWSYHLDKYVISDNSSLRISLTESRSCLASLGGGIDILLRVSGEAPVGILSPPNPVWSLQSFLRLFLDIVQIGTEDSGCLINSPFETLAISLQLGILPFHLM
jgi:hypothetical protein